MISQTSDINRLTESKLRFQQKKKTKNPNLGIKFKSIVLSE